MNSSHGKKSSPLPLCLPRSQASGAPQGRLFPPHRVALGTRRQLSLALQSSLPTSARACDIHCAPLPAPPPTSPMCSRPRRDANTRPHVGLGRSEPRASGKPGSSGHTELPLPGRASPGKPELLQPQRVPVHRARPPPTHTRASVTCRLFIFLKSPKMSRLDVGRCVPTAPARTMAGSLGARAARRLLLSHTAAEHRQAPPTGPHPGGPRDQSLSRASGNRSLVRLSSPTGPGGTGRRRTTSPRVLRAESLGQ